MVHYDLPEDLVVVFDLLEMVEKKEVDCNLVVCHLTLQRLTCITTRDLHLIILRGGLFYYFLLSVFYNVIHHSRRCINIFPTGYTKVSFEVCAVLFVEVQCYLFFTATDLHHQ